MISPNVTGPSFIWSYTAAVQLTGFILCTLAAIGTFLAHRFHFFAFLKQMHILSFAILWALSAIFYFRAKSCVLRIAVLKKDFSNP